MSGEHSAAVGEESGDWPVGVRDSGLPKEREYRFAGCVADVWRGGSLL